MHRAQRIAHLARCSWKLANNVQTAQPLVSCESISRQGRGASAEADYGHPGPYLLQRLFSEIAPVEEEVQVTLRASCTGQRFAVCGDCHSPLVEIELTFCCWERADDCTKTEPKQYSSGEALSSMRKDETGIPVHSTPKVRTSLNSAAMAQDTVVLTQHAKQAGTLFLGFRRSRDGLRHICEQCTRELKGQSPLPGPNVHEKLCTLCMSIKPAAAFNRSAAIWFSNDRTSCK